MLKKLRVTDYIIIGFILIVLFIGTLAVFKKKDFSNLPIEKETKIHFDVFFRGISISAQESPFKIGENAFITIRNVPYTKLKIMAVDGRPRMTLVSNAKNKKGFEIVEDIATPGLFDFVVRLEDNAKKTPDGYVAGGNKIKMGIPVVIEGELYKYQGVISNVFEVEEQKEAK